MNRRPTPAQQRKRNRRGKPAPRYHVEVADSFWPRLAHNWDRLTAEEQEFEKYGLVSKLQVFLNTRRPRRRVELFTSPKGQLRIRGYRHDGQVLITPLDPPPSE